MLKILPLFFCTLITTFYPSAKASAASIRDDADAAAPRLKKSARVSFCDSVTRDEPPPPPISRGHIRLKKSITWPDDISEDNRDYCTEKIIELELNLWPEEATFHPLPPIVAMALRNESTLETFWKMQNLTVKTIHAHMLASAILLDRDPAINIYEQSCALYADTKKCFLHFAIEYGTAPFMSMLCKRGAIQYIKESQQEKITASERAVLFNNIGTLQEILIQECLIKQSARPTVSPAKAWTALHLAVDFPGSLKAIDLLLEHGANPYTRTTDGRTALDLALEIEKISYSYGEEPCPFLIERIDYLEKFMKETPPELYEESL